MRRRRAPSEPGGELPRQPHINSVNAAASGVPTGGGGSRGRPPPPLPPPHMARVFVYQHMVAGATERMLVQRDMVANRPPFGQAVISKLYETILEEFASAEKLPQHARDSLRRIASERLHNDLLQARVRQARAGISDLDWARLQNAVVRTEELLSRLEGTQRPVEIDVVVDMDVRVNGAMMRMVADVSADRFDEEATRQLEFERRVVEVLGERVE